MVKHAPNVKLLSLGDARTGKSCLIKRFCEKRFVAKYMQTVGIDYGTTVVHSKLKPLKLHIFDTGGHEWFKQIREEFYENSQAILLTFAMDNRQSFKNVKEYWLQEITENVEPDTLKNTIIVVCGTKADSHQGIEVTADEARTWVESRPGWKFFETSSQTGQNVTDCFDYIFSSLIDLLDNDGTRKVIEAAFTDEQVKIVKQILHGRDNWQKMGLHPSASKSDVNRSYKNMAKLIHPDKSSVPGNEEAFKELAKVREALIRQVKS